MNHCDNKPDGGCSGGEARIAEMFLVLNSDSEFCILDEPFSNIAPLYIERMQEQIREKKKKSRDELVHHGYISQ